MRLASPLQVYIVWRECTNFANGMEGDHITTNVCNNVYLMDFHTYGCTTIYHTKHASNSMIRGINHIAVFIYSYKMSVCAHVCTCEGVFILCGFRDNLILRTCRVISPTSPAADDDTR